MYKHMTNKVSIDRTSIDRTSVNKDSINRVEIENDVVCVLRGNKAYVYNCRDYRIEHLRKLLSGWHFTQERVEYGNLRGDKILLGIVDWYTNPCIDMGEDRVIYYVRGSIHREVNRRTVMEYTELLMRGRFAL